MLSFYPRKEVLLIQGVNVSFGKISFVIKELEVFGAARLVTQLQQACHWHMMALDNKWNMHSGASSMAGYMHDA